MTRHRDAAEDGFVLVETIVAFLVLAIALGVGIETIAQGARAIRRAEEIARASLVVRELTATRIAAIAEEGVWTGRHPNGSAWRVVARAVEDGGVRPMFVVSIDVRPPRSNGPYRFQAIASGAPEP